METVRKFYEMSLKLITAWGTVQLLGHIALVAQRPIVIKLSCGRSVGPYMRRSVGWFVQCIVAKQQIGSGCRSAA